jgi:hypothetical protein
VALTRFDFQALRAGAGVCLVFAVPIAVAARWAAESRDDAGLATVFSLAALLGFILGSGVAAWFQQRDYPLAHGLVTALVTYVATQLVLITIKGIRGGEIHWFAAIFNVAPVLGAGLIGGFLGMRLQRNGFVPSAQRRRGPT